eukprot:scaffold41533_cov39-Phaeocystis_antarctica.AAC.2
MEDVERVEHVRLQAADTIWAEGGEVQRGGLSAMHTAQVDREVVVDEYPDVIVTREAEGAATVVGEGRVNFRAEVVVVTQPLIAEALAVDREVAGALEGVLT